MKRRVFYFGSLTILPITFICLYCCCFYLKYNMLAPLDPKTLNSFVYNSLLYIYPISFLTFLCNIVITFYLFKNKHLMFVNLIIVMYFILINIFCFNTFFNWFID